MTKPKLLHCFHSAEPGGVEKQILDIIRGLSTDFDIYVACPQGPMVKDYIKAGASHIKLKPRFEGDLLYSFQVFRLTRKEKIDIIHSHELLSGSLATFGAWLAGCQKRIYHVHTPFSQWRHPSFKKLPALIVNAIVNWFVGNIFSTDVIALTESIRELRIKKEHIWKKKISVIPNGVDLKSLEYSPDERMRMRKKWGIGAGELIVGNMARFTEEKGQDILLKAFAKIRLAKDRNLPWLVLAGGGKLLEASKKLAKELKISNRVIFTDKFVEEDKTAILSSFDLFVFPTHAEGFGIALIEAMANERPVIATDLPVLGDVAGDSIEYFADSNVSLLAQKIAGLLGDKEIRQKLSQKSLKQSQLYSMERFWQNYRSLYLGGKKK